MPPTTDFESFWRTKYFPSLDGLRALCVLMVMFNHIHVAPPKWVLGWLGVDVFFVLSGFLITTLLLREKETRDRISLKGFYTRRVLRIMPVYLAVVLLYIPFLWVNNDTVKVSQFRLALPWLLTFMQEFRPMSTGTVFGHAWTLGIEEKFYLLWPLMVVACYPFRRRSAIWLSLVAIALLSLPHMFARSYCGLLMGAALGIVLSKSSTWMTSWPLSYIPDWILCISVIAAYVVTYYNSKLVLLFSASVVLIVASLVLRKGILRAVLSNSVLVFIGRRSYAMYLVHVLAINVVERVLPKLVSLHWTTVIGLSYCLSLLGACVLYVGIERPCVAFGRRLSASFLTETKVGVVLATVGSST
jgi:peptidoglycan/LPS O-acetylase OafA/YrhL